MQNFYNLDFDAIYATSTVKNNTAMVKKILSQVPDVDFNDVDGLVVKLKESYNNNCADTTLGKDLKNLATFINILNKEDLAKMGIVDKLHLVKQGGAEGTDRGTYHKKRVLLEKAYTEKRNTGVLSAAQEERFPTAEEYDAHYEKSWAVIEPLMDKVTFDEAEANTLVLNGLVIMKHDMPDMRGGATYAQMVVNHQSNSYNHVIYSEAMEQIIFIYNRYKTNWKYGVIPEIIEKGMRVFEVVKKMIYVAGLYKVDYLFYDYEKKREYTEAGFNTLVTKAHKDIGITQADVRIINESIDLDKVNPVADLGSVIKGRKRRGHNMLEGYMYAKRMKQ